LEAKSSIFGWEFGLGITWVWAFGLAYGWAEDEATDGFGVSWTTGLTGWDKALTGMSICLSSSKPYGFSITFLMSYGFPSLTSIWSYTTVSGSLSISKI
jgi:hypothetical protein